MAATFRRIALSRYLPLALLYLPLACVGEVGLTNGAPGSPGGPSGPGGPAGPGGGPAVPGSPSAPGGKGPGGTTPGGPTSAECGRLNVGASPLRRLSHVEYNNAVADLLGDKSQPANAFPEDSQDGFFRNTASGQSVPPLLAEGYLNTAAQLAGRANVRTLAGCDFAAAGCVTDFIQKFGRRAFRRPLKQDEAQRLLQLYDNARTKSDVETGVRAVVAGVLVSPQFLYHFEEGAQDSGTPGVKKLAPFEVASRLGSLLWASIPDNELLDAAGSGKLATKEQVLAQADRMLKDPRARAATNVFYEQWFGVHELEHASKDAQLYPQFTPELMQSMREETVRFVNNVVWDGDGKLATMLSAPFSIIDARLAALYGVPAPGGQGFQQVMMKPGERAGIVTQASFLAGYSPAVETSPFKRGAWVRTRMLCHELPVPPNEVPPLPDPKDGVSNRQRAQDHTKEASCAACHKLIDGIGLGLEQYDVLGRVRTTDRGMPLDISGEVTDTRDINARFNGGAELARLLARSEQVRDCAPTQWLRYALARADAAEDACSLDQLKRSFATSGGSLRDMLLAVTQTDAFLHYRRPE
jgi:Protein of unknown function (DUF1592)/Protein of unknown function (DUF1588)/Protein of unknown function (DUF1595)/Protein of unknown function (DUF1587)/Protein of unknown function (DUF1585)